MKKGKELVWWLVGIVAVLLLGAALRGPIVSNVDPPWTLPFLRRNEVQVEIAASSS